ncbi:hypothetical protein B0T26DRAFT_330810 [Lasiosphaeria miniovina]|uniref:Uncharacterized protein n=1 Tax=Lasiosphaeria miniovina TaxID=1954250 RepID=A0AA40AMA7_9PEZI|nr:uncharacterized protein B0T26DRAFT_330810 [Lasiosphaeria miniovina]KAK0718419.1 hypothetical protein B0T26DRAFT_330810 [Lasiosphaeria miniovina]
MVNNRAIKALVSALWASFRARVHLFICRLLYWTGSGGCPNGFPIRINGPGHHPLYVACNPVNLEHLEVQADGVPYCRFRCLPLFLGDRRLGVQGYKVLYYHICQFWPLSCPGQLIDFCMGYLVALRIQLHAVTGHSMRSRS